MLKIRLTEYYPFQSGLTDEQKRMEGGIQDRLGKPLYSLEDYVDGNALYVSLACDSRGGPPGNLSEFRIYGYRVRIPWLETRMGLDFIEFRLVDTGGHFTGKHKKVRVAGYEPIDVCRREKPEAGDAFSGTLAELQLLGKPGGSK
jgi:hypothetical protein